MPILDLNLLLANKRYAGSILGESAAPVLERITATISAERIEESERARFDRDNVADRFE